MDAVRPDGKAARFCVVTPNYNMAGYLEETILSVLRNLAPGDEYYIIDGGSTDGSLEIIRRYEDRLSGWLSEPDRGYADAIAKGFAMSASPLMCWINSGDLLLDGTLELRRAALGDAGCDLLFGDDYYIDEAGLVLQHSNGRVGNLAHMMLFGEWTPLQDACAWQRSLYEACGGLDADIRHAADYDLFLRMSLAGKARYLPAVLSAFRRPAEQKSVSGADSYAAERRRVRKRMLDEARIPCARRTGALLWYGLLVRLRARIPLLNRRRSAHIGRHITDLKARRLG